jgi:hypothetical protein
MAISRPKQRASTRSSGSQSPQGGARDGVRRRRDVGRGPLTLERLEDRIAPARAALRQGVLAVDQVHAGDVITLRLHAGDPTKLDVLNLGAPVATPFTRAAVTRITVDGGGGQDTLVIDAGNGNPVPSGGISYDGGGGAGGTLVAPNGANAWNLTDTPTPARSTARSPSAARRTWSAAAATTP